MHYIAHKCLEIQSVWVQNWKLMNMISHEHNSTKVFYLLKKKKKVINVNFTAKNTSNI